VNQQVRLVRFVLPLVSTTRAHTPPQTVNPG